LQTALVHTNSTHETQHEGNAKYVMLVSFCSQTEIFKCVCVCKRLLRWRLHTNERCQTIAFSSEFPTRIIRWHSRL